jgi:hypothetical protein
MKRAKALFFSPLLYVITTPLAVIFGLWDNHRWPF